MKTTPEMFESGTFPPYNEVAKTGHDKFAKPLGDLIAKRRKAALKKREEKKK